MYLKLEKLLKRLNSRQESRIITPGLFPEWISADTRRRWHNTRTALNNMGHFSGNTMLTCDQSAMRLEKRRSRNGSFPTRQVLQITPPRNRMGTDGKLRLICRKNVPKLNKWEVGYGEAGGGGIWRPIKSKLNFTVWAASFVPPPPTWVPTRV